MPETLLRTLLLFTENTQVSLLKMRTKAKGFDRASHIESWTWYGLLKVPHKNDLDFRPDRKHAHNGQAYGAPIYKTAGQVATNL